MKVRGRGRVAVTRPTGRREYVHVGSTAAIPAADACRSSNRTLFGVGIVLHIEKLDKESQSTNFHSKFGSLTMKHMVNLFPGALTGINTTDNKNEDDSGSIRKDKSPRDKVRNRNRRRNRSGNPFECVPANDESFGFRRRGRSAICCRF